MKRFIVIAVCLVVVFGVMGGTYLAYCYHSEAVKFDDLNVKHSYIDNNGVFKGEFSTDKSGMHLCDYDYEIDGSTLYITLYQTPGEHNHLKLNKDGNVRIEFSGCKSVRKLYYRNGDDKDKIELGK